MRYWVLKGPPDDAKAASTWLEPTTVTSWRLKKAAPDWSVGDGIFLWEGGGRSRIVGVAELAGSNDPSGRGDVLVRTLAAPLAMPLHASELRFDVVVGDAPFLQNGARQVTALSPDDARRLGRLISRQQRAGADCLARWFGPGVHQHKATVAADLEDIDGSKPIVLVAIHDPKLRSPLVSWAQEFWDEQVVVIEREDGQEAWATALEHPPALFIVSEMLTSLSGLEIAHKLKKQKGLAQTKLAILGLSDISDEELRKEWGSHAVLRKPLRRIEVDARLGHLVEL